LIVEDERLSQNTQKAARSLNQLCLLSRGYQDAAFALLHQRDLCHALAEQLLSLPSTTTNSSTTTTSTTPVSSDDKKRVELQQRLDASLALCRDMCRNLDKSFRHYDERRCALLLASYQTQTTTVTAAATTATTTPTTKN
jgi:hypothetical protein